jgi:hypothetical protein
MNTCLIHLERLHEWLRQQGNRLVLSASYNNFPERPHELAEHVCEFLGGLPDIEQMVLTEDPSLYRNKKSVSESVAGKG